MEPSLPKFVVLSRHTANTYTMCYSTPCQYGKIETHNEEGFPIKPIVTCYSSPFFNLARHLTSYFRQNTGSSDRHLITYYAQLATELKHLRFTEDCRIILIDINSIFTKIPVERAADIKYELLVKSSVDLDTVDKFWRLILACTSEDNICKFNGTTFKFPLSIVTEVFMDRLECWVLHHWRDSGEIIIWYRFVDDVFCIWRSSDQSLEAFKKPLHSFDKNIKLTTKIAGRQANYLNITVP